MQIWPLKALGISYKSTPVQLREPFSRNEAEATQLLLQLRDLYAIEEALVLSTCGRTEVYYVSETDHSQAISTLLCPSIKHNTSYKVALYQKNTAETTAAHLFNVALGVDSQILGDQQILHQTKRAYQRSVDAGLAGPCLHRLMHSIFYTHKRVAKETNWCCGTASLSYAAVELLGTLLQEHKKAKILLLGIGEIGKDIARNLPYLCETANIYITNRSAHKATALAQHYGYQWVPFTEYPKYLKQMDALIVCTEQKKPIITKHMLQNRHAACMCLLDMSIPRGIASQVEELPGVLLYNIDDIKETTSRTLTERKASLSTLQSITQEAQEDFFIWCQEFALSPVIQRLKKALEQLRKEEIARYLKDLNTEESHKIDKITRSLVQRIIKYPVLQLKAACKRGEAHSITEVLNDLFDLEQKHPTPTQNRP